MGEKLDIYQRHSFSEKGGDMKVISVVNQKGGCGKTITAVNLSAGLSKTHKVLLIDLDPQGHATFALGANTNFTITDIFEKISQEQMLPQEGLYTFISENFSIVSSSIGLASLEHKLTSHSSKLQLLSSFLKKISEFDYVILDCPPNLGVLTLNALIASDYCLIPLMACDFSLRGMEILKNILIMIKESNGRTPTPFFFLNQVDNRSRFAREFVDRVTKQLGTLLLTTKIRTNVHLKEAASKGKNIFDYKPKSRGAEDFGGLAKEVERIITDAAWAPLFLKGKDLSEVYVVGDFNNWKKEDTYKLNRVGEGIWSMNLPLRKGKYCYKFLAEGRWFSDPHNNLTENDHFGGKNSVIIAE